MAFDRGSHELNDTASFSSRAVVVCNHGVCIDASSDDVVGADDDNDIDIDIDNTS